ncbi:major histocompatibility complex class I-related gene protein-like [Latimeria chalumnae]|uniref:major histocompatibility complex class I-related gene protein-like n=1 Tax=Latimeria chalumnae TaxID=7897 RepID=UPI00313D6025
MYLFLVFLSSFQVTFSGTHIYRITKTLISDGIETPHYIAVGILDDVQVTYYDSHLQQYIPKQKFMLDTEAGDRGFWTQASKKCTLRKQIYTEQLKMLIKRSNRTGDHILQVQNGCEIDDQGNKRGFQSYAFDGVDFMSFDQKNNKWLAAVPEAMLTAQSLNLNKEFSSDRQDYLSYRCFNLLEKHYSLGKETFEKKVPPKVSVHRGKYADKAHTLSCVVTGFYPRAIDVMWLQDGNIVHAELQSTGILPNHDETYQIRKIIEIDPSSSYNYSCQVEHASLKEALTVQWVEEDSIVTRCRILIPVCSTVVVVVLIVTVAGLLRWKKRRQGKRFLCCVFFSFF